MDFAMLYLHQNIDPDTSIHIWKAEEALETISAEAGCAGDPLYESFGNKRKKEWAFVRYLLRQIDPDLKISYKESGKPILNREGTKISISHTKDYVAIMLNHAGKEIGIDIEKREKTKVLNVIDKFMSQEEQTLTPTPDAATNGLLAWTTKEALFKLIDPPHINYVNDFHIRSINMDGKTGTGIIEESIFGNKYDMHYAIEDDFVTAWVME